MKNLLVKSTFAVALTLVGLLATANTAHANVAPANRALLIITDLDTRGAPEMAPFYKVLEDLGTQIPQMPIVRNSYGRIVVLRDRDATAEQFIESLKGLASRPDVQAIDAFVMLHGGNDRLVFSDGGISDGDLAAAFLDTSHSNPRMAAMKRLVLRNTQAKLRLVYNTSCYGQSHFFGFREMGFKAMVGSKKVNANSEVEFPSFLTLWNSGATISQALAPTNSDVAITAHDAPLRALGHMTNQSMLKEIDSKKAISGDLNLRIVTRP